MPIANAYSAASFIHFNSLGTCPYSFSYNNKALNTSVLSSTAQSLSNVKANESSAKVDGPFSFLIESSRTKPSDVDVTARIDLLFIVLLVVIAIIVNRIKKLDGEIKVMNEDLIYINDLPSVNEEGIFYITLEPKIFILLVIQKRVKLITIYRFSSRRSSTLSWDECSFTTLIFTIVNFNSLFLLKGSASSNRSEIRYASPSERGNVGTDHTAQNLSLGIMSIEVWSNTLVDSVYLAQCDGAYREAVFTDESDPIEILRDLSRHSLLLRQYSSVKPICLLQNQVTNSIYRLT